MISQRTRNVANYFIREGIARGTPITLMQVLKLVYFAHGWNLAVNNEPLIPEAIQAWDYGPVVPEIYRLGRHYGARPVINLIDASHAIGVGGELTPSQLDVLEFVWRNYGHLEGWKMSALTHQPNSPWTEARNSATFSRNARISDDLIRPHFVNLLHQD